MKRSVWFYRSGVLKKLDFEIDCNKDICLLELFIELLNKFTVKCPATLVLDMSSSSLDSGVKDIVEELCADFALQKGESITHARMRYSYEWCVAATSLAFPRVDCYCDVSFDEETGLCNNAVSACLSQLIRTEKRGDVLKSIDQFEIYYNEKVGVTNGKEMVV